MLIYQHIFEERSECLNQEAFVYHSGQQNPLQLAQCTAVTAVSIWFDFGASVDICSHALQVIDKIWLPHLSIIERMESHLRQKLISKEIN
mgnify:CR=1 FL=1